jgi:hypothetical protein
MQSKLLRSICLGIVVFGFLSGCSKVGSISGLISQKEKPQAEAEIADTITPKMRSEVRKSPANLGKITVADAAKVSDAELEKAVAKPVARPERDLGKTIASLGLIDETGFWLQTPLVQSEVEGRVVYLKTETSINLRLIPNGAAAGSGSQISIAAMKVLGIPIVDLAELQVFIR